MKKHTIQFILTLLLAALLLTASACGEVDPLAPKSGDSESPEDSSEVIVEINPRPADADWSAFESGEDDGTNDPIKDVSGVLAGDWFYPSVTKATYGYLNARKYHGRTVQTAYKYNLTTRECTPFCLDATCRHSTNESKSDCPFAGGCRVIAVDGDLLYYTSRYPSSEDDGGSLFHPSIYCYDMKNLGSKWLFSHLSFMQMFDFYQCRDGKIYYVEDELVGDYDFERYLCAYDLSSGKTERLLRFDGFRFPDPKRINVESMEYDIGLMPRAIDGNGIVYFQTIRKTYQFWDDEVNAYVNTFEKTSKLYIADLKNGGEARLLPGTETEGGICGVHDEKIYVVIEENPFLYTYRIQCYDPATEAFTLITKEAIGGGRIHGDILWYLSDEAKSVVMQNLKTGETKSIKVPQSEEGKLDKTCGIASYKDGQLLIYGFTYSDEYGNAGTDEMVIFDLVTGKLYPLHVDSPDFERTLDDSFTDLG